MSLCLFLFLFLLPCFPTTARGAKARSPCWARRDLRTPYSITHIVVSAAITALLLPQARHLGVIQRGLCRVAARTGSEAGYSAILISSLSRSYTGFLFPSPHAPPDSALRRQLQFSGNDTRR